LKLTGQIAPFSAAPRKPELIQEEDHMTLHFTRRWGARLFAAAFAFALSAAVADAALDRHIEQPSDGWTTYVSDEFGYSVYYPSAFFEPQAIAQGSEPKTFLSFDKTAKLVVSGVVNDEGFTADTYRTTLLRDFGGYEMVGYMPRGKTWFVLSGTRGENTYYQKVIFSCANRIINVFSVTFPTAEKSFYSGLIEVMEDRFRTGLGGNAPTRCQTS
jgi:hypothetical protein